MQYNLRKSCQLNNWQDKDERNHTHISATKAQTFGRSVKKDRINYVARLSHRAVQEMWEIKLPVCRWKRTRPQLLSFCQYAWIETCHDLYSCRIQVSSRKSF